MRNLEEKEDDRKTWIVKKGWEKGHKMAEWQQTLEMFTGPTGYLCLGFLSHRFISYSDLYICYTVLQIVWIFQISLLNSGNIWWVKIGRINGVRYFWFTQMCFQLSIFLTIQKWHTGNFKITKNSNLSKNKETKNECSISWINYSLGLCRNFSTNLGKSNRENFERWCRFRIFPFCLTKINTEKLRKLL